MRRLLVVVLALATFVTACGGGGGGGGGAKPLKIAVVPKAIGFDFWNSVRKGADCAASKQQSVSVVWNGVTAETDVTGQVSLLQNYITQKVDGLVYAATDAKALYQVSQQATQAGIPTINIDSGTTPQPDNVPVFKTDNVAGAKKAADFLAQAVGDKGKVALIEFEPGSQTNDQRASGFKDGLKGHPNLQLVADQPSHSDYNTALRVATDILTAHPDLDGIFAANEPSVLGASEALRSTGKAGKVKLIGWDASPDELKGVQAGIISDLVVQNPFRMGWDGVNAAVKMARDKAKVPSGDTGVTFLNKDNINDPKVQAVTNPSCTKPPVS